MQEIVGSKFFPLPFSQFLIYLWSSGLVVIEVWFFPSLVNFQKLYVCNKKDLVVDRRMSDFYTGWKTYQRCFLYEISAVKQTSLVLFPAFFPGTFAGVRC